MLCARLLKTALAKISVDSDGAIYSSSRVEQSFPYLKDFLSESFEAYQLSCNTHRFLCLFYSIL